MMRHPDIEPKTIVSWTVSHLPLQKIVDQESATFRVRVRVQAHALSPKYGAMLSWLWLSSESFRMFNDKLQQIAQSVTEDYCANHCQWRLHSNCSSVRWVSGI